MGVRERKGEAGFKLAPAVCWLVHTNGQKGQRPIRRAHKTPSAVAAQP